jgi:hypothetical protein
MRSIIDATYVRPAWSSRLCDRAQHLLLVGDQSSHAWPVLHPLEMRQTILELGKVEVELRAASKAPEKVGIDGGEMVEEPLATGELECGSSPSGSAVSKE